MDPLVIRTFGYIRKSPLHSTTGTKNNDYMLCVFIEGTGHCKNKAIECTLQAGQIAFFLPEDPGILYSDSKDPYSHYYCRFNGSFAKEIVNRIINIHGSQVFKTNKLPEIELILKKMKQERREIETEMRQQEGLLFQILFLLSDIQLSSDKSERYMRMLQYLESRIDQPLIIEEMSKAFHLSTRQLNRIFKENAKTSIGQYHEKIKINLAKTLLSNTDLNIQNIAKRVGYKDALYFSRVFKKATGHSPQIYRNNRSKNQ